MKWCLVRRREIHGRWHDHGHGHEEETLLAISKLLKELTEEEDMKVQIWISWQLKWCLVRRREIHGSWHDHGHGHEEETLLAISKLLKELTEEEDMKVQIWISSARPRA